MLSKKQQKNRVPAINPALMPFQRANKENIQMKVRYKYKKKPKKIENKNNAK